MSTLQRTKNDNARMVCFHFFHAIHVAYCSCVRYPRRTVRKYVGIIAQLICKRIMRRSQLCAEYEVRVKFSRTLSILPQVFAYKENTYSEVHIHERYYVGQWTPIHAWIIYGDTISENSAIRTLEKCMWYFSGKRIPTRSEKSISGPVSPSILNKSRHITAYLRTEIFQKILRTEHIGGRQAPPVSAPVTLHWPSHHLLEQVFYPLVGRTETHGLGGGLLRCKSYTYGVQIDLNRCSLSPPRDRIRAALR